LRRNPLKPGLKIDEKPGRPWHVIAGPGEGLHPTNLRVGPEVLPRTHTGPLLIKSTTPPVNVIGGYRFPGAPTTADLGLTTTATPRAPATGPPIDDDPFDIPAFLKRNNQP
jgi:hypothetical protein